MIPAVKPSVHASWRACSWGRWIPLTARRELNILMPAARIKELKDLGHAIHAHRITLTDEQGRTHCGIALYYLPTAGQEVAA